MIRLPEFITHALERVVGADELRAELDKARRIAAGLRDDVARLEDWLERMRAVMRPGVGTRDDYRANFCMVPGVLDVALVAVDGRIDAYVIASEPLDRDTLEVLARNFTPVPFYVVVHVIEHGEHVG